MQKLNNTTDSKKKILIKGMECVEGKHYLHLMYQSSSSLFDKPSTPLLKETYNA
jgi:hypothetical protein